MKNKIITLFVFFLMLFTLAACGGYEEIITPPDVDLNDDPTDPSDPIDPSLPQEDPTLPQEGEVEFVVSLVYNKKIYIPESDETITVIWQDDYSKYEANINNDGFAKIKLDGEFNVHIDGCPENYTYNPNIYIANNENPVIEIELLKISKTRGTGLLNQEIILSTASTYRAEITSATKKIYYSYTPKSSGYYSIKSLCNIYDDTINPKLDAYSANSGGSRIFDKTYNTGGDYKKGGYTRNFDWVVNIADDQVGGVFFVFAVYADSKTNTYPVNVDFTITYLGDYYRDDPVAEVMEAKEANFKTDNYSKTDYTYYNSDHGTGSYYNGLSNGTGFLRASDYKYNEEDGYWHLYDSKTNTFGPILCAAIVTPCAYYECGLSTIEDAGNKNLTVSNATENYKEFIEIDYANASNSDGVCYVTMELKEFLQKFSVSQRLFMDGNGFVEQAGVYAIEDDQWLFACGYYKEN